MTAEVVEMDFDTFNDCYLCRPTAGGGGGQSTTHPSENRKGARRDWRSFEDLSEGALKCVEACLFRRKDHRLNWESSRVIIVSVIS